MLIKRSVLDTKLSIGYTPTPWYKRFWYEWKLCRNKGNWDFSDYPPIEKWDRNICFKCFLKNKHTDIWQSDLILVKEPRLMMSCCATNSWIPVDLGPPDECPFQVEHLLETQNAKS